ncbi:MAG: hypothetical protein H0X26_06595 [Alphaproteobacteria bacterium]|nr:hypothetical protein [Alphaproteobacteria bacterium]
MEGNNYLYAIALNMTSYQNNILYIEKILEGYNPEDKIYLLFESNKLKKKLKKLERLWLALRDLNEEFQTKLQQYYIKYFEEFQAEFHDFLIFLKWNNFGELQQKLQAICIEKSPLPFTERKNYKRLLDMMGVEI